MAIDWKLAEEEAGSRNYVDYAPEGEYEVAFDVAVIRDNPEWKSPMVTFTWVGDTYKYPTSKAHWLSMAKPNWRAVHFRDILMELGVSQEKAQQLVEAAEKNQDREKLVQAYQHIFDQLSQRHPKVKVIVRKQYRDGKPVLSKKGTQLSETEFANRSLQLGGQTTERPATPLGGEEINLDDIPF